MYDSMDTHPPRITDLITFQQHFKTNPQGIYKKNCESLKRMKKTKNVNEIVRNKNYELTSTMETQNTTIQNFKQFFLFRAIFGFGRN